MRALVIVAILLAGLAVVGGLFGGFSHMGYGMGPRFGGGPGFLLLGAFLKILFIVGLVLIIGSYLRRGGPRWHGLHETPLDILRRRLAKGEISREDYETLKTELS